MVDEVGRSSCALDGIRDLIFPHFYVDRIELFAIVSDLISLRQGAATLEY